MSPTKNHEWILEGIDCANCASKIEKGIAKMDGISRSNVNFMTKTLQFEIADQVTDVEIKKILTQVKNKIAVLEPDVTPLLKINQRPIGSEEYVLKQHKEEEHIHPSEEEHSHSNDNLTGSIVRLIVTIVLLLTPILVDIPVNISFWIYVIAYLVAGYDVVWRAVKNIVHGQIFDENFLMTIATLSAFYIQQYPEAVSVMLFYQIGELFQAIAVNRSRRSIADLMDIRPDYANKKNADQSTEEVSPEVIQIGDIIVVRPGEKVPLDGKVISGSSSMDTTALTGESMPKKVQQGDQVLSGFINKNGYLEIEVEKTFGESTVVKILDLVENAGNRKATTENFITKFARYYTPIVVGLAILLAVIPPLLLEGATFNDWLYRASIFLVISCPCALVVSIPVSFFGGIGSASKKGILIKGSNFLEGLNDVKYVVMDKTGTLTKGKFEVTGMYPSLNVSKEELLQITAYAELHSSHPIAESVKKAYGKEIDTTQVTNYNEIAGQGIQAEISGKEVLVGNSKLMDSFSISYEENDEIGTVIYVAINNKFSGSVIIADAIKEDAEEAIREMKKQGVTHTVMLTGDSKIVGEAVAQQLGIDEVYTELLPQDKVEKIEELMLRKKVKEKIIFVGDGINDTPVLARSDIGIAMGGLGSDAAIEAADIVIMNDQPSQIAVAMQVAKDTRAIVWQNIIFAMAVKGLFLFLGAFGVATMWEAVFADVGVTILAVLNAMRIMRK